MPSQSVVLIEHPADPRLEPFTDLKHREASAGRFIVEGRLPVGRLLESDYEVESLLVECGREREYAERLSPQTTLYALSRDHLKRVVGFDFHRGVLACGRRRPLLSLPHLIKERWSLAIALIGISELENAGSLLRSAAAFGVRHVLVGPGTVDPFARRVIRVSMANLFRLRFYELDNPVDQLPWLSQQLSVRTIAATPAPQAEPLSAFRPGSDRCLLMVGNEAEGLPNELIELASDRIRIPMQSGVDSLNVAVAGAICLYGLSVAHCLFSDLPAAISPGENE